MTSRLLQVLQTLEPRLRRHRPLARACPQLLFDLSGLLSGLRSLIMLDHAPGATPAAIQQVLQPLPELLPGFKGCILQLDGCCYLANSRQLLQRLAALAADASSWPCIISFAGGQPAQLQPEQCTELQQQLQRLFEAVQQQTELGPASHTGSTTPAAAGSIQTTADGAGAQQQQLNQGFTAVVDLGEIEGLPVMPTVNGFLLAYPAVYWVQGYAEAAAASRLLSMSRLQLFTVRATCVVAGCSGSSSSSNNADGAGVLMAFTVPELLCGDGVNQKVQQLMARVTAAAADAGSDVAVRGCVPLQHGDWTGVRLVVESVGPQPVSL